MHPEQTKAKILEASDALFGEKGFDATSTRDIALRSGINKALIHYHFGTKEELLDVLLDGYYQGLTNVLAVAWMRHETVEDSVQDVVDTYGDFLAENQSFCRIVQREVASGEHVDKIVRRTLPILELGTKWLDQVAARRTHLHSSNQLDKLRGEMVHMLTTIYGMIVTYFTYSCVLQRLTMVDPLSTGSLVGRKDHVRRVTALLFSDLQAQISAISQEVSSDVTSQK